jgi:hypothetical protein
MPSGSRPWPSNSNLESIIVGAATHSHLDLQPPLQFHKPGCRGCEITTSHLHRCEVDSILSTFHANPTRAKFAGKGRRLNPKTIDMEIPLASQRFARPTQLQISIQLPTNSSISRQRQEGRKPVQLN